jgi:ribosomal protein S11
MRQNGVGGQPARIQLTRMSGATPAEAPAPLRVCAQHPRIAPTADPAPPRGGLKRARQGAHSVGSIFERESSAIVARSASAAALSAVATRGLKTTPLTDRCSVPHHRLRLHLHPSLHPCRQPTEAVIVGVRQPCATRAHRLSRLVTPAARVAGFRIRSIERINPVPTRHLVPNHWPRVDLSGDWSYAHPIDH